MKVFVVLETYSDYDVNGSHLDRVYSTLEAAMKRGDELVQEGHEIWDRMPQWYKERNPWFAEDWSEGSPLYDRERLYEGEYNPSVVIREEEVRE